MFKEVVMLFVCMPPHMYVVRIVSVTYHLDWALLVHPPKVGILVFPIG